MITGDSVTSFLHGPAWGWAMCGCIECEQNGTRSPPLLDFGEMGLGWWSGRAAVTGSRVGKGENGFCMELFGIAPGLKPRMGTKKGGSWIWITITRLCGREQVAAWGPWLSEDAACATEGATCFSTVVPLLITRSYAGPCASYQPNHNGFCVQKIAPSQRSRQSLQKTLSRGEAPIWHQSTASPCKQSVMTLGSAKAFLKSGLD